MDQRTPIGSATPLVRPTDQARRAVRAAGLLLGALALLVAVPVGVAADLTRGDGETHLTGVVAGLVTLTLCWTLLAIGLTWWRSRLASLDEQQWTDGWAQVEPGWSGRS